MLAWSTEPGFLLMLLKPEGMSMLRVFVSLVLIHSELQRITRLVPVEQVTLHGSGYEFLTIMKS